jgi:hypothetical protein
MQWKTEDQTQAGRYRHAHRKVGREDSIQRGRWKKLPFDFSILSTWRPQIRKQAQFYQLRNDCWTSAKIKGSYHAHNKICMLKIFSGSLILSESWLDANKLIKQINSWRGALSQTPHKHQQKNKKNKRERKRVIKFMVSVSTEFKARSQVIYIHQHHGRLGKKIT